MPNVFEVLRKDHDEVKAMLVRLEAGPAVTPGATVEQIARRRNLVDEVIIEESTHEAVEQQYFWPLVRVLGPDGGRIAEEALEQETQGEWVLNELEKLEADDERFEAVLATFISAARAHIAFEEAHAWPLLATALTVEQADELGDKIARAKKTAPTRPHPSVSPAEGTQTTPGTMTGIADRLRDAVTGRGRHS
jgi:Hemerythrin HHE cation binding domain